MSAQPKPGDTVYGEDGHAAEFVAKAGGEYIVRPFYEDDYGPQPGDVRTWTAIFITPPSPKLDAETAAAERRLAEVKAQVREMEQAKRAFESEEAGRLDRIKRHEQLAELDRYLAGELTHYVAVHAYYPSVEVIPVGETLEDYGNSNGYGILQLRPNRMWDKRIVWSVTYKQPSLGYSKTSDVVPCCGEEAAMAKAAEIVRGYLSEYQAMEPAKRSYTGELVESCQRFGVDVPAWLLDGIAEAKKDQLKREIAESRARIEAAEANLAVIDMAKGGAA